MSKDKDKDADKAAAGAAAAVKLVQMHRHPDAAKGGPTEADVHPDEVGGYVRAGWVEGTAPKAEPAKK